MSTALAARLFYLPGFNLITCQPKTGSGERFSLHSQSRSLALGLNHSSLGSHINYPSEALDLPLTAMPFQVIIPLFLDHFLDREQPSIRISLVEFGLNQ